MSRLPVPGADNGVWGNVLNDFLSVEHNSDGTLKASGSLSTKADDSAVVHNAGNETIAGIKTFTSSPIVPTPTTGTQATTKSYVDTAVSATVPTVRSTRFTSGNITFPNTSGAWQPLLDTTSHRLEIDVPAAVGNWVELAMTGMISNDSSNYVDVAVMVNTSIVRFLSTGTSTPPLESEPSLYPQSNWRGFGYAGKGLTVASGDLDTGNVRFVVVIHANGVGTFFASTGYPFYMRAINFGSTN